MTNKQLFNSRINTLWSIKHITFIFWITLRNIGRFQYFLAYNIKKKLDANNYSFEHFTLIRSLHYLVKCRSRSLRVYNNEFILNSARVGSEMVNWIATNTIGNYCFLKSHKRVIWHNLYYSMCSKCFPPARMQAVNVDTTC